ncbi:MAG: hypothetical protein M9913_08080 [Bryobacteraceae bacterium]|nr:hypothetical protein [Solibacteraceae bacterium]MCO5350841.1 hypothetical protein [Bryobacteraceae bacterium]HRJ21031.1 hypothetical protein [Bryobacteraceae bacterium]
MRSRLKYAFAAYILIAVAASATLDGHFRWIVLVLLAALAFKSWIAVKRQEQDL